VDGVTGEILDGGDWEEDLFEEGEIEDEPPPELEAEEGVTEPPPAQQKVAPQRPLTAEKVRESIRKKANWQNGQRKTDGEPVTLKQVPYVATLIGELFPEAHGTKMEEKNRHDLLTWLLGVGSTTKLTKAEASALIDWMQDKENSRVEAGRVLEAIAIEAGQQKMAL
jgi:hypothetical protein